VKIEGLLFWYETEKKISGKFRRFFCNSSIMTQKSPKVAKNFYCLGCDYKCFKKSDYVKHLSTDKHKRVTNDDAKVATSYQCDCGKLYSHRQGLYAHKKKCNVNNSIIVQNEETDYKGLLFRAMDQLQQQQTEMTTQRKELMEQLNIQHEELRKKDELMEQMIHKVGHTTNHNNQFNINMFLNETCKNAINLSDFIERIEISHDDLENNAQLGFVNGMTKILMDNLRQLTLQERPIHCTDVKRETLYIKDEDVWDKTHSNEKLENAIQEVSRKSMKSLLDWKRTNPEYKNLDSDFSKRCIPMHQNSTAISKKDSFYPKIIHMLAKENSITELKTIH